MGTSVAINCSVRSDCYWWYGQNKRTCESGQFPRALVDPQRKITSTFVLLVYCIYDYVVSRYALCLFELYVKERWRNLRVYSQNLLGVFDLIDHCRLDDHGFL